MDTSALYAEVISALQKLASLTQGSSDEQAWPVALQHYERTLARLAAALPHEADNANRFDINAMSEKSGKYSTLINGFLAEKLIQAAPLQSNELGDPETEQALLQALLDFRLLDTYQRAELLIEDADVCGFVVGITLAGGQTVPFVADDCFAYPNLEVGGIALSLTNAVLLAMRACQRLTAGEPAWPGLEEDDASPLGEAIGRAMVGAPSLSTEALNELLLEPDGSLAAWLSKQLVQNADISLRQAFYESRHLFPTFFTEMGWTILKPEPAQMATPLSDEPALIAISPVAAARALARAYRAAEQFDHWHDPWEEVDHSNPGDFMPNPVHPSLMH